MNSVFKWLSVIYLAGSLFSCKKNEIEHFSNWGFRQPENFPSPVYNFEGNKQSFQRFVLGRALFYDTLLSSDKTVSCASCHHPTHAFAGHNTAFSPGVNGLLGNRNSPALFNLAWTPEFMWDGGINHIEIMPVAPITNPVELNETFDGIIAKLKQSERYKKLFKDAYGNEEITEQKILKSLTQFMTMLISDNSKYDRVKRGETTFSAAEQEGYDLFVQKCSQCHTEPLFTDFSYRNNGLDETFSDLGRATITQIDSDRGKFKVPSLRNVEFTYPYMHDGRFYTLNQVLEHYNSGVKHSATLDTQLENGIPLTGTEKLRLISFLKTLTDYDLMSNSLLLEPKN